MKHAIRVSLAVGTLACAMQPAAAAYWSSIATACVPDSISIQDDRYQPMSDNAIVMKNPNVKPVVLICGVQPNEGSLLPNTLEMTYLDSTGPANTAAVQAQLIRVNRTTGARAVVTTVNSNSFAPTAVTKQSSAPFSHTLNFENFYYYVRIVLDRDTANLTVRSIGVALISVDL